MFELQITICELSLKKGMPIYGLVNKEDIVYINDEILLAMRNKGTLPFVTCVGLDSIMPSEIIQIEKQKYCMVLIICELYVKYINL